MVIIILQHISVSNQYYTMLHFNYVSIKLGIKEIFDEVIKSMNINFLKRKGKILKLLMVL